MTASCSNEPRFEGTSTPSAGTTCRALSSALRARAIALAYLNEAPEGEEKSTGQRIYRRLSLLIVPSHRCRCADAQTHSKLRRVCRTRYAHLLWMNSKMRLPSRWRRYKTGASRDFECTRIRRRAKSNLDPTTKNRTRHLEVFLKVGLPFHPPPATRRYSRGMLSCRPSCEHTKPRLIGIDRSWQPSGTTEPMAAPLSMRL